MVNHKRTGQDWTSQDKDKDKDRIGPHMDNDKDRTGHERQDRREHDKDRTEHDKPEEDRHWTKDRTWITEQKRTGKDRTRTRTKQGRTGQDHSS